MQVILSLVSDNPCRLGFFQDPRRQCVALSRAKRTMTLVSNLQVAASVPALVSFCREAGVKLPTGEWAEEWHGEDSAEEEEEPEEVEEVELEKEEEEE